MQKVTRQNCPFDVFDSFWSEVRVLGPVWATDPGSFDMPFPDIRNITAGSVDLHLDIEVGEGSGDLVINFHLEAVVDNHWLGATIQRESHLVA